MCAYLGSIAECAADRKTGVRNDRPHLRLMSDGGIYLYHYGWTKAGFIRDRTVHIFPLYLEAVGLT